MSLRTLETAILAELRFVAKRPKLGLKDIREWSTSDIKAQDNETLFFLPDLKINVAVLTEVLGKKTASASTRP